MERFQIPPPPKFDFTKPEEWPKWIRRFERFRIASGLALQSEENQTEQRVSLENLKKLQMAFEDMEMAGTSMDLKHFKRTMKMCLNLENIKDSQIQELFMKIDYSGQGRIQWDEVCTYMQMESIEKEKCTQFCKQVAFTVPATIKPLGHGEPILKLHSTPDRTVVSLREDGTVCYWSSKLQLKKSKHVFHERPMNRKPKWATDFILMPQYNKLLVGTGEREIQFFEMSSLEPYCQISSLETVPLQLDYCYTCPDECAILYGDAQGCVNIILMTSVGEMLRTWKKFPKVENVPNIAIDTAALCTNVSYIRWKVHQDWVTQVKYLKNMEAVISTSNHDASALVIGCVQPSTNVEHHLREVKEPCCEGKPRRAQPRALWDQTIFTVPKGVTTFDLCKKHNLLLTGGMDRLVRIWNPYVPGKPTAVLKGHYAPICYLYIDTGENHFFSVSMDNTVKIWHAIDQTCLFTAHPRASLISGDISAALYSPGVNTLYIATDSVAMLSLRTRPKPQPRVVVSHSEPVLCCGYSEEFRQVVSCTEGSVVKVWNLDTGSQVFEFGGAHGLSAITCMTFDPEGRRLVTGGRDGCLKIWNFNNGHCLQILKRDGACDEICDCTYLKVHRNMFVMCAGWSQRLDMYADTPDGTPYIQKPQPYWQDDLSRGHKDDILCIAQCPPSLLATGSCDGEIIVWSLASGHIQSRFLSPVTGAHTDTGLDRSVRCLAFLRTRTLHVDYPSAACLISSGPHGYVFFWNVLIGGRVFAKFEASKFKLQITKVTVTNDDSKLYSGDEVGYVYIYDIKTYALHPEHKKPKIENYWRAHINGITGLEILDNSLVLTSSTDCTVRLWTVCGEFIGTFGQPEAWSLHIPSSWKHPAVPYDILIDPLSMPSHSSLDTETSTKDIIHKQDQNKFESQSKLKSPPPFISDADIETEVKSPLCPEQLGKRLRHEIFKNASQFPNHGGPKAYHTLKYFDIAPTSAMCERPDLSLAGTDPFISNSLLEEPQQS
ncbi:WD repeat-containing protein on Y chromosome isoform X3 [Alosa alosa]|uniref:WD repeat-containing protein on Y chromosome isoform X3 n=1 Tax=Alosa alosa TaxID=278164 RepID=UPI002015491E|nr:WD repeat-containing protein on Y chromosome isoform X3 [Alosa alosa]